MSKSCNIALKKEKNQVKLKNSIENMYSTLEEYCRPPTTIHLFTNIQVKHKHAMLVLITMWFITWPHMIRHMISHVNKYSQYQHLVIMWTVNILTTSQSHQPVSAAPWLGRSWVPHIFSIDLFKSTLFLRDSTCQQTFQRIDLSTMIIKFITLSLHGMKSSAAFLEKYKHYLF